MNRTAPLLAVFVLLVAAVSVPAAGAVVDSTGTTDHASQAETATSASNGSAGADAPGARFAGVVDVQEAEVESELEERAFDVRMARSDSDDSKAAVVAENVDELTRRTEALRERKRTLNEARENGSISEARYRAETAVLAARLGAVERQLDRSEAVSRDLPDDTLESRGVNATAIETLRNQSRNVADPETDAIARSIAGPRSGDGLDEENDSPGRSTTIPDLVSPPNGTDERGGPPGTDDFDTPTLPGRDNGTGPPTRTDGTDLPNVSDEVPDVLSPIIGESGGDGSNETDAPTDTATPTETTTDAETETDGNESTETPPE